MSKETDVKNTRQDYLDGGCSHRQYYGQFVNASVLAMVKRHIGEDAILKSSDEHFNDIPLKKWDTAFHVCPAWISEEPFRSAPDATSRYGTLLLPQS